MSSESASWGVCRQKWMSESRELSQSVVRVPISRVTNPVMTQSRQVPLTHALRPNYLANNMSRMPQRAQPARNTSQPHDSCRSQPQPARRSPTIATRHSPTCPSPEKDRSTPHSHFSLQRQVDSAHSRLGSSKLQLHFVYYGIHLLEFSSFFYSF